MAKPPVKLTPEVEARCARAAAIVRTGYTAHVAVARAKTSTNALTQYLEARGLTIRDLRQRHVYKGKA